MDVSHQDPKDQGSPGYEANIDSSSTDPDISLHTISLPSMMPSLPMNTLSPTSPSLPPTQTGQPPTHASGCPMRSVQWLQTALHKCCDTDITEEEISNGSTVVHCPRWGCETVWVS